MRAALGFVSLLVVAQAIGQTVDSKVYEAMRWREVGPYRGGRSVAVSGVPGKPDDFYMGTCGGGLWKTTNSGQSWSCVSDGFFETGSVGAIGVSESNSDVVYVGMGETDIRGNITHGDGVYKTTDGGKTWTNVGLRATKYIARVKVHPTDPNTVYVAALGPVYGASSERGIYKTKDGGLSWEKILYVDDRSGGIDLVLDPKDPDALYAATWTAWRTPFSLNSGGPGSKLWKSINGGSTWMDLSSNIGMPAGPLGKIGIAVSGADSKRLYASIEAHDGGIFKSEDAGKSWTRTNEDRNWRQRAWYYSRIFADPKNVDTVYILNVGFGKSTDGGKTFRGIGVPHSDNHDLWIDPTNPQVMVNANDGGGNVSKDGGQTWTAQTYSTAQIYHVSTDNAFPYRILGAQQDNSTIRIASRGPDMANWTSTAGGESGYVSAHPKDPDIVFGGNYSGSLDMQNHRTGESRSVDPWPDNPMGHGAIDLVQRFQWTYPIIFSPHDANTLYTCSQFLLKSNNLGKSWSKISPDLTRNDPKTLESSGGPITKDNTGVEYYATIFTFAESPKKRGVLWCGSDDGLVHVSQNGGRNWTNITPAGMPEWGLCSMIEASRHNVATAYLAVDNHENNDHAPYIYKTEDFGRSWSKVVGGLPRDVFVRVVREDPNRKGLLYAGTETGVWVSFNDGIWWQPLQMNLPNVPVHDLTIKEDDLVAATHGRGFWILDDISALRQMVSPMPEAMLFKPKDAYRVRFGGGFGGGGGRRGGGNTGPTFAQPLSGVVVNYYLAKEVKDLKFEFLDKTGALVASSTKVGSSLGFQRFSQWLQYPSYRSVPGMIFWAAGPQPITAPPGEYTVRMTADGNVQEQKFRWVKDPRSSATDKDLVEQSNFARQISAKTDEANNAVVKARDLRTKVLAGKTDGKIEAGKADDWVKRLTEVEEAIYQTKMKSGQDPLNYPVRLNNKIASLLGTVLSGSFGPTRQTYDVYNMLVKQLQVELDKLKKLESEIGG
ncbi:MAG TPA: hypothetical protein PKA27_07625 [Fimbriimonadaceae bacterium]|nr:hypothetical protein [Fimbriimonadaceae bacterium]